MELKSESTIRAAICFAVIAGAIQLTCAAPTIEISPQDFRLEKGGVSQLWVTVTAKGALADVTIAPIVPCGFSAAAIPAPGIRISDGQIVHIDTLTAESQITVAYKVMAPDFFGFARDASEKEGTYSTREAERRFAFNVFYTEAQNGEAVRASQAIPLSFRYTTSIGFYLIAGMLGIIIGYLVKTSAQYREEISGYVRENAGSRGTIRRILFAITSIFMFRVTGLITSLTIGFGALLILAKGGIPVTSWDQAIATGVGLAILADEQLLAKIKTVSGR